MSVSGNATIARKKTLRCKLTLCNRLAHSTQLTHRRDLIRTHVSAALRKRSVGSHISKATPSLNKATGAADGRLRFRETRPKYHRSTGAADQSHVPNTGQQSVKAPNKPSSKASNEPSSKASNEPSSKASNELFSKASNKATGGVLI